MAQGRRLATWLLGLSIFATGFCGLVSEFLISTVSSYILGNSIEQFSVIIALMMAMMGVAGVLQRFFPDRRLVEQFIAVEMLLALLGGFAPILIYAAYGWLETHFLLVLYTTAGGVGFLIGFELPLVLRINAALGRTLPSNLAVMLSLDYIGGFVGALVWTRYLLRELPLTESSFLIAGVNFAVASVTFLYFTRAARRAQDEAAAVVYAGPGAGFVWVGIVVVAALLATGYVQNREWSLDLEQRLYDERIVFSETTRYQRIVITEDSLTGEQRLFLNGNLQLSSNDEAIYHEQLVHPAMALAERRARVLILGGGDGLALREVLLHRDVRSVTLVDLDPRMTELAATNAQLVALNRGAFADARVQTLPASGVGGKGTRPVFMKTDRLDSDEFPIHDRVATVDVVNIDADRFVEAIPGLWDVVLIDFPDPNSVELAKLYSREFYRKLRHVLAPDSVIALQATSPYHSREAFLCILRTLESAGFTALPYHDDVPSFGSWGWILATAGRETPEELRARAVAIASFPASTRYLTPDVFKSSLVFGKARLESQYDEVNTLMRPILLDLYLHASWLAE